MTNLEGKGDEPLSPSLHGAYISILVQIGYPGSKISDIILGSRVFQVPNSDLRYAARLAEDNIDTAGG